MSLQATLPKNRLGWTLLHSRLINGEIYHIYRSKGDARQMVAIKPGKG